MTIFHSLGSNYNFKYSFAVLKTFFSLKKFNSNQLTQKLQKFFPKKQVFYFYKGREALTFGLEFLDLKKGDLVLTQAFSCCAIEQAITSANLQPLFMDLAPNSTKPTLEIIKENYKKYSKIKVLILQNTFGYYNEYQKIYHFCQKNNIYIIQDLAQSFIFPKKDFHGNLNQADIIILSFGRDKIIDVVNGGACLINQSLVNKNKMKNIKEKNKLINNYFNKKPTLIKRDFFYPILMTTVRNTHQIFIGKILLFLLKKLKAFPSPADNINNQLNPLHSKYLELANFQLDNLGNQLNHRKKIAKIYFNQLNQKKIKILINEKEIEENNNLRIPCQLNSIDQKKQLLQTLRENNFCLSDNWYQKPIDCGSLKVKSSYKRGSCPNVEKLNGLIFNLPTHINVSEKKADEICELINKL